MAQTVGSDIARMAREAGAKLLPGIFSEDKGDKAPKTGGAKASQVWHFRFRGVLVTSRAEQAPKTSGAKASQVRICGLACKHVLSGRTSGWKAGCLQSVQNSLASLHK